MHKANDITHTELSGEIDSGYWHILSTKDVLKKWYLWNEHSNSDRWHIICECEIWEHECTCRLTIWEYAIFGFTDWMSNFTDGCAVYIVE